MLDRLSPVHLQAWPGLGKRINSGCAGLAAAGRRGKTPVVVSKVFRSAFIAADFTSRLFRPPSDDFALLSILGACLSAFLAALSEKKNPPAEFPLEGVDSQRFSTLSTMFFQFLFERPQRTSP